MNKRQRFLFVAFLTIVLLFSSCAHKSNNVLDIKWDYFNTNHGYFSSFVYNDKSYTRYECTDELGWMYDINKMENMGYMEVFRNGHEGPMQIFGFKINFFNSIIEAYCLKNESGELIAIANIETLWLLESLDIPALGNAYFGEFWLESNNYPQKQTKKRITLECEKSQVTIADIINPECSLFRPYDSSYETHFSLDLYNSDISCLLTRLQVFYIDGLYYTFKPYYRVKYEGECEFIAFDDEWQNYLKVVQC